ncbi:MAG: hypothetical protein AVDCRST_MAG40-839 [uncultured Gemmatimonadaceae bacterium]|uniref:histidine kinase n=1 Tax=uncultured Gemmatimonadaceae bacterium TaxID=246130 RepID=A0A6J4KKN7_9BACT|nr:MAG: hypothetical protein AVDCRST_MAG40-839 [uncultured Gemmatimonadaceae bacterium]
MGELAPADIARFERAGDRVLESLGEAVCVLDDGWRFAYWNAAAERMSGVSRETLLGRRLTEQFAAALHTDLGRICRETMQTREPRELRAWRFGGGVGGRGAGIYDARSYPVDGGGVLVLFDEVSARVAQEAELAERVAEGEALRELARAMAAVTDSATLLAGLCDAAMRLGNASGALVSQQRGEEGEYLAAAGTAARAAGIRFPLAGSMLERAVRDRAPVSVTQYEAAGAPLDELAAATAVGPVLAVPLVAQNQLIGALFVIRQRGSEPFTARDQERLAVVADHAALALWKSGLIEDAQAADQAKGNFLATVSHELRTPLTALTGYGELLADEIVGALSRQQLDIVERMRAVTHHLTVMIDEILTYSALEAGSEQVRPSEASAAAIVEDAVAVIEPLARQKGLSLEVQLPDHEPALVTDVDKVRQILVNLAGNAVKFTDSGAVRLVVSNGDGAVRFAVHDTGAGIAPDDQARIFQPFAQVESGLTRRHGGTGLGLYISRRLASLLGGRIELESVPGEGSTFSLVLPAGDPESPARG